MVECILDAFGMLIIGPLNCRRSRYQTKRLPIQFYCKYNAINVCRVSSNKLRYKSQGEKHERERERGGGRRGRWDYHPINYPIHAVKYVYSLRPVIRFINSLALAGKIIMPSD